MKTRQYHANQGAVGGCVAALLVGFAAFPKLEAAEPLVRLGLGGDVGIDLVLIRAGSFMQGSLGDEAGRGADETARLVMITHDYYMSRSSVTRGQWERFVAETGFRSEAETGTSGGYGWDGSALVQKKQFTWRNPGFPQTSEHPICLVTYPDAEAFCNWIIKKTQRETMLPTEAQWEYACRAGTTTSWHSGATADGAFWHKGNSENGTHPVNSKPVNPWGLFISGNVSEWCLDWYAPYQTVSVTDPLQDNPNLSDKPRRVLRGGSWLRDAKNTRSAARYRADPRSRNADIGFRIVCAVEVVAPPPPVPKPQTNLPNVEVDPAMPAQVLPNKRQAEPMHPQSSVGFAPVGLFSGLLCFLIPIGLIVLIVRFFVVQGKKQAGNPFVVQAPPQNKPLSRSPVRIMDDGFWILGDWPAGTLLSVRYMTRGVPSTMDLFYQPGPQGQFVFTGTTPESASVVTSGGKTESDSSFAHPLPLLSFEDAHHPPSPGPSSSRPPIFPSAY